MNFFCTIANKNTATTYVRTGGLCYKTREICHGVIPPLLDAGGVTSDSTSEVQGFYIRL